MSALLVWITLAFQLNFFMTWAANHHFTVWGGIWSFFSFFTNLSNMLAGAVLVIALIRHDPATFRRNASLITASVLYLCMTGIIFNLELSQTVPSHHPAYLVNMLLHNVTPLVFLGFWLACVPRGHLGIQHVLGWLVFPMIYFGHVMLRGWLIAQYPYAFFNAIMLGYPTVLLNGLQMLTGFFLVGLLLVGMDRIKRR